MSAKQIAVVDLDNATYVGSSEDGIYFDVAQNAAGWYMSAVVDCNTGHFCDSMVTDDGPYASQAEALQAGLGTAYDWCVTNEIRGWRTEATKLSKKYRRMAKQAAQT